jgi:KDO2-lipid IV(A) lauroyltransferase
MSNKVSDMVIRHLREKNGGCVLVEKNNIVRHILQKKSEGGIYYFMADQYPDKGAGMDFELLGQPTRVYNGVELLARRLSMPVVYISVQRLGRGRYRSEYVKICDDACATPEGYVTREYVKLLEESINVSRSTWLWSHRRWKNIKV